MPGVSSSHTTYTLFPSTEICGSVELPVFSLRFSGGALNVRPPSVLLAKKISKLPGVSSCHTTYRLFPSTEICGLPEIPVLFLCFVVAH